MLDNDEEHRACFERLAYQRYLDTVATAGREGQSVEVLIPASVFWRTPDGFYGVHAMNSAWWGYQAGIASRSDGRGGAANRSPQPVRTAAAGVPEASHASPHQPATHTDDSDGSAHDQ